MPLKYVRNVKGWRYGKTGKLYTGKGARQKAIKQGQAIEISKHVKANKHSRGYVRTI